MASSDSVDPFIDRSGDDLQRYFTLKNLLPANGGLFGSQWAQHMADEQDAARRSAQLSYAPLQLAELVSATPSASPVIDGGPTVSNGVSPVTHQLAARARGTWDHWSPQGCANCHGYTPTTLPPYPAHVPFPPDFSPRIGGPSGETSSGNGGDRGRNPPQCTVQYDNDSDVCRRVGLRSCWASASERRAYCIRSKGEVGWPPLITK